MANGNGSILHHQLRGKARAVHRWQCVAINTYINKGKKAFGSSLTSHPRELPEQGQINPQWSSAVESTYCSWWGSMSGASQPRASRAPGDLTASFWPPPWAPGSSVHTFQQPTRIHTIKNKIMGGRRDDSAALTEGLSPVPSSHMVSHNHLQLLFSKIQHCSDLLRDHGHMRCTNTHPGRTRICVKK